MGRLAGFRYRDVAACLRALGFEPGPFGKGSHEGWIHPGDGRRATLTRHPGDIPEGLLRRILTQAGISPDDFLAD